MYCIHPHQNDPIALAGMLILMTLPTVLFLYRAMNIAVGVSLCPGTLLLAVNRLAKLLMKYVIITIGGFIGGLLFVSSGLSASAGFLLGGLAVVIVPHLFKSSPSRDYRTEVLRGRHLITHREAFILMLRQLKKNEPIVAWAGVPYPDRLCTTHFCITGSTGSGKTVLMRLLMQSVLPFIRAGSQSRALIYDAKQDLMEILSGMPLQCEVKILNPLDLRSYAWDMSKDITNVFIALQVGTMLIRKEKGQNENTFFSNAARDLFSAVLIAMHDLRPYDWTFADVLLTLSDSEKAERFLRSCRRTRRIAIEYYTKEPKVLSNIESTISANIAMLRPFAALSSKATNKISLKEWVDEESILVLGNDDSVRAPLDAINRVMFQRVTELILAKRNSRSRKTWFFLDELKEAGRLDNLDRLLTKGRSKGVRAVLAWQAIEGLREVYGDKIAEEVAGMCSNKAFLRTDSYETAKWNSQVVGELEVRQWMQGHQRSGQQSTSSMTEQIVKKELLLPSEFMSMNRASSEGFEGYFITPETGPYAAKILYCIVWQRD